MNNIISLRAFSASKILAFIALFSSLTCVCTLVITIPLPIGYFNVGDVFVLLAAWCLGPIYGAVSAGIGGALADIISGYANYAPATFIIKMTVSAVAYYVWSLLKKIIRNEKLDILQRGLAALIGEASMVLGYFLYESILYGVGAATGGLFGNTLQGVFCAILATVFISTLRKTKRITEHFPTLKK